MICPQCTGAMKVLFTGWYCPKDCDRAGSKPKEQGRSPVFHFEWKGAMWSAYQYRSGERAPEGSSGYGDPNYKLDRDTLVASMKNNSLVRDNDRPGFPTGNQEGGVNCDAWIFLPMKP